MNTPSRIRAAVLWGNALENRINFDAAYWFAYFDDDAIMEHFKNRFPSGDAAERPAGLHPEWGFVMLVTELPDEFPGIAEMFAWLASKGAAECIEEDDPDALPMTEFIAVYVSRVDALGWLHTHRPDLYADIKSTYSVPPPEHRFFP